MTCQNCTGAITEQKRNDEKILKMAREKAKSTDTTIGLYRNEYGELCIATGGEQCYLFVTPNMQDD